jgi:hypothetical protein
MRELITHCLSLLMLCGLIAGPAAAQQIVIDKPVKAGELTLFPDLDDDKVYYFVSDKPRLATDERGNPQFSFLRFVDNVRSGAGEAEIREGEGGGILHALVSLAVTEDQLREAQRELRRIKPSATIEGPVIFRSGRFALVSSFTDPEGGLSQQVVGLGSAPILDGQKAAVSMLLTKQGAKILWQSFHSPTPDISFSFEMELAGFRSPVRAVIEADFDQIYEHTAFSAGIASSYLSGEIKTAFDDLRTTGAIKLTQVGADADLEALVTTAYNKIVEMMFQPVQGTGTPTLASLAGLGDGGERSMLDRATEQLNASRADARQENERIRRENREAEERRRREGSSGSSEGSDDEPAEDTSRPRVSLADQEAGGAGPESSDHEEVGSVSHEEASAREAERQRPQSEVAVPSFAIVAAFEMKQIRQRGKFNIDLNKYTTDNLTMRFDENIGDLTRFLGDQSYFREVNLDDPLYRQREILVFLDGLSSQDFDKYVNFVTVQMRKRHEGGDETFDEVRIDRSNFNSEGNAFKMLYGWKGDNDRDQWLDYEFRSRWSFFGGFELEQPWQPYGFAAVNVTPPLERRTVELEADPDLVADAGMRAITVQLFYQLGGEERTERVTLSPRKDRLSSVVEYLAIPGDYDYEYEVSWRLQGNQSESSGRLSSNEGMLFVDELP